MEMRCNGCMQIKKQSPQCEHCGFHERMQNYPGQLPIGTVLRNQYQIGRVLGQGGFGITYIGWDMALENPVAIKEYYPKGFVTRESTDSMTVVSDGRGEGFFENNRERFLREAKILAKLRSIPEIVCVHSLFSENNTAYIVMEFIQGINLKQYMRMQGSCLSVQETLALLRPVMQAIGKVHDANLIHRDISPDNIMLQPDGQVKLLDFGSAREVTSSKVESTGVILKKGFAPVEQYHSRGNLGPWTDVYSLCATIYYCLTGKVPAEAPARIMNDDMLDWKTVPGLSPRQIAALEKGMALRPKERLASVAELISELFQDEAEGQDKEGNTQPEEPLEHIQPQPEEKQEGNEALPVAPQEHPAKQPEIWEKIKKYRYYLIFAAVVLCICMIFGAARNIDADGWKTVSGEKYYIQNGKEVTGFRQIGTERYYFDENGVMKTGWISVGENRYYASSDGAIYTGWLNDNGNKYYFSEDGRMITGIRKIEGEVYIFGKDGALTREMESP